MKLEHRSLLTQVNFFINSHSIHEKVMYLEKIQIIASNLQRELFFKKELDRDARKEVDAEFNNLREQKREREL